MRGRRGQICNPLLIIGHPEYIYLSKTCKWNCLLPSQLIFNHCPGDALELLFLRITHRRHQTGFRFVLPTSLLQIELECIKTVTQTEVLAISVSSLLQIGLIIYRVHHLFPPPSLFEVPLVQRGFQRIGKVSGLLSSELRLYFFNCKK